MDAASNEGVVVECSQGEANRAPFSDLSDRVGSWHNDWCNPDDVVAILYVR
jgi:hypothetical protein